MLEEKIWIVEPNIENENAASYLQRTLSLSNRDLKTILKFHLAGVDHVMITKNTVVHSGQTISCTIPDERPADDLPEDIPLHILYEDDDCIVINKPKNMTVIPGPGNWHSSLLNALKYYLPGEDPYVGIVHRIDKTTTGCIIIGKHKKAAAALAAQIAQKSCYRMYRAICEGNIEQAGTIDAPIGRDPTNFRRMAVTDIDSKTACTHYVPIETLNGATDLRIQLETGRTHQIRVHMAYISHPVLSDSLYGHPFNEIQTDGAVLHAEKLIFQQPTTKEEIIVEAPLPAYYTSLLNLLKRK